MNTTPPQTARIVAPPPLLYIAALALSFIFHRVAPRSISMHVSLLHVVGATLFLLSSVFARWAFVVMKKAGTSASPRKQSVALTTNGPFALSRNPIYVAMTGLYLGIALLGNSLWSLIMLIPLLFIMHWGVVRREEHFLAQQFKEAYLAYTSRTRRWL